MRTFLSEHLTAVLLVTLNLVWAVFYYRYLAPKERQLRARQRSLVLCAWCHQVAVITRGVPSYCPDCGHQLGVARVDCSCIFCRQVRYRVHDGQR